MKESVSQIIELKINRCKPSQVFSPSDFKELGTSTAIRKALSRLVESGKVERMGQGIYVVPKKDKVFGKVLPSMEHLAEALAKKEHVKIKPSGQYALNKVGLSTQVPMRLVFLTTGNSKRIQIGKSAIIFKSTTAKKLSMKGDITSLLFLGLEELDLQKISPTQMDRILELLKQESPENLKYNLRLAPTKVSDFVVKNFSNPAI
jgi:predicted transcriptional regulator of viral defense system